MRGRKRENKQRRGIQSGSEREWEIKREQWEKLKDSLIKVFLLSIVSFVIEVKPSLTRELPIWEHKRERGEEGNREKGTRFIKDLVTKRSTHYERERTIKIEDDKR